MNRGFIRAPQMHMHVKRVGNDIIHIVIYVNDITITCNKENKIEQIKFSKSAVGFLEQRCPKIPSYASCFIPKVSSS